MSTETKPAEWCVKAAQEIHDTTNMRAGLARATKVSDIAAVIQKHAPATLTDEELQRGVRQYREAALKLAAPSLEREAVEALREIVEECPYPKVLEIARDILARYDKK